ncbi:MAG: tetratricopeptide repeat protein [Bacteroidales bacterium]
MRKIIALFVLVGFYSFELVAQQVEITWPMVVAETEKSDEQIKHHRKKEKSRIWVDRGRKYVDLYTFDLKEAFPGMNETDVLHIMKNTPESKKTKGDTTIYIYPRLELYFSGGKLVSYERTGEALESFPSKAAPLDTAKRAYIHARELDNGRRYDDIAEKLTTLVNLYTNEGYYHILAKDYEKALPYFSQIVDILDTEYDDMADSSRATMLNDCAVIAYMAEDYENAISYYTKSIEQGNNTIDAYGGIMNSQKKNNDTIGAIKTVKTIIQEFSEDTATLDYITELVNLYLGLEKYDEALEFLNKAVEKDPENTNFLLNIAILQETSGNKEEAIKYYKKVLEIDPNNIGANANMALLYVSDAREILQEANEAYGTEKYKPLQKKGQKLLKKAIPYYEKYIENESDVYSKKNACTDLMSIYSQLRMDEEYERVEKIKDSL